MREPPSGLPCRDDVVPIDFMLFTLAAAMAVHGGATVWASRSTPPKSRTVPCSESLDGTRFPYVRSNDPKDRYRLVLRVVSVPPAYRKQVVRNGAVALFLEGRARHSVWDGIAAK